MASAPPAWPILGYLPQDGCQRPPPPLNGSRKQEATERGAGPAGRDSPALELCSPPGVAPCPPLPKSSVTSSCLATVSPAPGLHPRSGCHWCMTEEVWRLGCACLAQGTVVVMAVRMPPEEGQTGQTGSGQGGVGEGLKPTSPPWTDSWGICVGGYKVQVLPLYLSGFCFVI